MMRGDFSWRYFLLKWFARDFVVGYTALWMMFYLASKEKLTPEFIAALGIVIPMVARKAVEAWKNGKTTPGGGA